jgi:serine/threonine protein kinase
MLKFLHKFGIFHNDIKFANTLYNPIINKWTFIDYGNASYLFLKPGQLVKTHFVGSLTHVSPEMFKTYKKQEGLIDLRLNDFHAFKICL